MYVIGTAGHVDHGKSTLIQALTGINPDRLHEEQERQMTIDLGFAWFTLPSGLDVGIVDVPGHRDFIENMLAGIGGIDAVIFIIAADEGVMPQTREHLAILDILGIQQGIIALTKIDLVEDSEWLTLVEEEINKLINGTVLENAPIVRVSSTKRIGLENLVTALDDVLKHTKSKEDKGNPRLPVDRVFSLKGHGTIVTGTLIDGCLKVGQEVEILPSKITSRIRSIQTHKKSIEVAEPGSRTAINLVGVSVDDINRGDVLNNPGMHKPTWRVDASFRMLDGIEGEIDHDDQLKCFIGTQQRNVRIRVIGQEKVQPGQTAWLQIETSEAMVAANKDHFILRRPSPSQTLGGGIILNPYPVRRYRRFSQPVIATFKRLSSESPMDLLILKINALGAADIQTIIKESGLAKENVFSILKEMLDDQLIALTNKDENVIHEETIVITKETYRDLSARIIKLLEDFHLRFPIQDGYPTDQLRKKMGLSSRDFQLIIQNMVLDGLVMSVQERFMLPNHKIVFTSNQQKAIDEIITMFRKSPFSPPKPEECIAIVGRDIFQYLLDSETLVLVAPDVVFNKTDFDLMKERTRDYLMKNEKISVSGLRDLFHTSRKYALAFLENLDKIGMTKRDGDYRYLIN